ncbi:hypothetical protein HDV00_005341 [Rhizophlyctis rosea]|nr:hypothetical protein HDV00_005341 [Rhizophlyctis rosea]
MVKLTTILALAISPLLTSAYSIGRFSAEPAPFNPNANANNPSRWNPSGYPSAPPVQDDYYPPQAPPNYPPQQHQNFAPEPYRFEQSRPQQAVGPANPFAKSVKYDPAVNNGRWAAAAAQQAAPVNPAIAPNAASPVAQGASHGAKAIANMFSHTPHAHGFRGVSYAGPVAGLGKNTAAKAAAASKPEGTLYAASPEFQKLTAQGATDLGVPDNINGTSIVQDQLNAVRKINVYSSVTGIILIVTGLVMVFLGHKLIKPICFIVGFYAGGIVALLILSAIENRGTSYGDHRDLIYIITAIILGLMFGGMFLCLMRLAFFALGGLLGFVIATAILSAVTGGPIATGLGRGLFIAGFVILFAILVAVIERPILVLATAFVGAFGVAVGVDAFVQAGLANAVTILVHGGRVQLGTILWVEIGGFALLGLIGTAVQWRFGKKDHYSHGRSKGYKNIEPESGKPGMQAVHH